MKSFKIGLSGKKGAGKDTVADMLQKIIKEDSGLEFQRTSFAAELYRFLSNILGVTVEGLLKQKDQPEIELTVPYGSGFLARISDNIYELMRRYHRTITLAYADKARVKIYEAICERLSGGEDTGELCHNYILSDFRGLIQEVGTDIIKNKLAQDFWIELSGVNDQSLQIFSDVRFDDEAVPFVENGFLIHVNAYEGDSKQDCSTKTEQHISEQFDGEEIADVVLHNLKDHMTLQDLEREVRNIYTTRIRPILLSKGLIITKATQTAVDEVVEDTVQEAVEDDCQDSLGVRINRLDKVIEVGVGGCTAWFDSTTGALVSYRFEEEG